MMPARRSSRLYFTALFVLRSLMGACVVYALIVLLVAVSSHRAPAELQYEHAVNETPGSTRGFLYDSMHHTGQLRSFRWTELLGRGSDCSGSFQNELELAWWAQDRRYFPSFLKCGYNIEPRQTTTLCVVVALAGDRCRTALLSRWERVHYVPRGNATGYDLVVLTDDSTLVDALTKDAVPVLLVDKSSPFHAGAPTTRATLWNVMQDVGRRAGFELLAVSSCHALASPAAIRALQEAFSLRSHYPLDHLTLVVPTTNHPLGGDDLAPSCKRWWDEGVSDSTLSLSLDKADAERVLSSAREIQRTIEHVHASDPIMILPRPMNDLGLSIDDNVIVSRVQRDLSKPHRVCLDASFFMVHLRKAERFAPYLDQIFVDPSPFNDPEDERLNRGSRACPADDFAIRMLAANVPLGVARRAFVFTATSRGMNRYGANVASFEHALLNVMMPLLPKLNTHHRSPQSVQWKVTAGTAISSCDMPKNYVETRNIALCKNKCASMPRCQGFSFVKAASICYLKSCAKSFHSLRDVDSYVKVAVPISYKDECVFDQLSLTSATTDGGHSKIESSEERRPDERRVAILITVHDAVEWVSKCVLSIWAFTEDKTYDMYLINDGSSQDSLAQLEALVGTRRNVRLVNWNNSAALQGYTRAINFGLRAARADEEYDAYCLLNSDTEVLVPRWLELLLLAAFSSPEIGIVGPLSNAASYQSVPKLKESRNGKSDWSKNELPPSWSAYGINVAVMRASRRTLIDVPVLNGFCLFVKRAVVEKVGMMDDVAFPQGFGEENDFCLRAKRLGYSLKVFDGGYIWHYKSKSYGDSIRHHLSSLARQVMLSRWGSQLTAAIHSLDSNFQLKETRRRISAAIYDSSCSEGTLRVLFVLNPIRKTARESSSHRLVMHGGWISVVNQAWGLRQRGACAAVAVPRWAKPVFDASFQQLLRGKAAGVFIPYSDTVRTPIDLAQALYPRAAAFDMLIATLFTTVEAVGYLASCHPHIMTGYFIQDYEADFQNIDEEQRREALQSYSRVADMLLFAKTEWLKRKVELQHNITVSKVTPSLDLEAFEAARRRAATDRKQGEARTMSVVAMVRPATPRRQPVATMMTLADVKLKLGAHVEVHTFGCDESELRDVWPSSLNASFLTRHHGTLDRDQVATLFSQSDIFLDMSIWQGFGRTGLEAMGAGCVPVLPAGSGTEEYARQGVNALLHNSTDAVSHIEWLVHHPTEMARMRAAGLETARRYDISTASFVMLDLLCNHTGAKRKDILPLPWPCLSQSRLQPERTRYSAKTATSPPLGRQSQLLPAQMIESTRRNQAPQRPPLSKLMPPLQAPRRPFNATQGIESPDA